MRIKRRELVSFSILTSTVVISCSANLEERVNAYVEANNSHDIEKIMSFYADDVRFEIVDMWVKTGKDQVRELAEWDTVTHVRMEIDNITTSGDTVTFDLAETNDWFKLAGIDVLYYKPNTIVFQHGKIREIRAQPSKVSLQVFEERWRAIMEWASRERVLELAELMPNGEFVYGAESAKRWLALLREWRQETRQ